MAGVPQPSMPPCGSQPEFGYLTVVFSVAVVAAMAKAAAQAGLKQLRLSVGARSPFLAPGAWRRGRDAQTDPARTSPRGTRSPSGYVARRPAPPVRQLEARAQPLRPLHQPAAPGRGETRFPSFLREAEAEVTFGEGGGNHGAAGERRSCRCRRCREPRR